MPAKALIESSELITSAGPMFSVMAMFILMYIVVSKFLQFKDISLLERYEAMSLISYLPPFFPTITVPLESFKLLTAKQINALLRSSAYIPPIDPNYAFTPFLVKKSSFYARDGVLNEQIAMITVELEVETSIDLDVELYCGVFPDAFTASGIIPPTPSSNTGVTRAGSASPSLNNDIPMQVIPTSAPPRDCSNIDKDCTLAPSHASYVQKLKITRKETDKKFNTEIVCFENVPIFDSKFYKSNGRALSRFPKTSHSQIAKYLDNYLTNPSNDRAFTFMVVCRPAEASSRLQANIVHGRADNRSVLGQTTYEHCQLWHCISGSASLVARNPSFMIETSDSPATNDEVEVRFTVNYTKDILHSPLLNVKDKSKAWMELEDLYGSTGSTTAMNDETKENEPIPQCVVCLTDPAQVCILPCRHFCMCSDCWRMGESGGGGAAATPGEAIATPASPETVSGDPLLPTNNSPSSQLETSERPTVRWSGCPVCRGSLKAWIEVKPSTGANFFKPKPSLNIPANRQSVVASGSISP